MTDYNNVMYLGNPTNTIKILEKYGFFLSKKIWTKLFDRQQYCKKLCRKQELKR